MKASDFTTGGNDREKAMSNLLKTEKTDAVNTGLVEKADKSAKALKGDLYSVGKKGTHGAGSTALDAIARKRKKTSAADALDGKSRSQLTGKNALTKKVQSRHNLNKSLKRGAKGVAAKAAHNALKDSELEGTDDLVATTHTGAKLAGKARKHLRSGKDALEKKDSLGALSEKKYRTEKLDKKAAQKRMQFSKYFHRNVYENAAAQAGKKKALTILSGGIKGMLSSLAGAVSQFFPLIIAFILAFGLISVVGGGAADEEQKSASLDGMPAWVTYDLVLACLNAHEQYGYPASALLGQMMIENGTSDSGSDLGRLYHNYGGVKYAGYDYGGLITGSVKMLTTEYSASGSAYKTYANFAVFKDDDSYMKYRCEHLYKQSNYTRVPNYQRPSTPTTPNSFCVPSARWVLHRVAGQLYRPVPFHLPSLSPCRAARFHDRRGVQESVLRHYPHSRWRAGLPERRPVAEGYRKRLLTDSMAGSRPLRHMDNNGLCKSRSCRRRQRQYAARQSGIRCQLQPETRHHRPLPDKGRNAHLRPIRLQYRRR
ncbi:hypothetical protein DXA18_13805 [Dorea sp. AM58-8]|nr:glucosaminidase domain-containing protein [Dorea sp. AM58-8]RGY78996.1 hypothetical protein DXA18_13805 [Dorea sp. AM58-8]